MRKLQSSIQPVKAGIGNGSDREIVVLHTHAKGTASALRMAASLGNGLYSRIRLIALRVVPFPLALNTPPVSASFTERAVARLAEDFPEVQRIDVLNCREEADALCCALHPVSIVLLGPPKHWWNRREARLSKALIRMGHTVLSPRQA